ncbi:hypothetical protein MLD38_025130 [Melastoma candidum]|uniref:Uncharacterized protein n=1 Tax=Melastoma candidum TaxID=119954 RepID=A0ACB9NXA6_9MYRT|nr:hypothetical protein MLD38_025130 [Melastoma candidum]
MRCRRGMCFAWTAMITGYAQNQRVDIARKLFEVIPEKNEVSWMTILMGYTQSGRMKEASELFDAMLVKSVVCCNAMILGYGQTGEVDNARKVFNWMREKDEGRWSAMISCMKGKDYSLKLWICLLLCREKALHQIFPS